MPRRQKNKLHAREKHHGPCGAQSETESLKVSQATATKVQETPSLCLSGDSPQSYQASDPPQEPQKTPATSSPDEGVSCPKSDDGAKSQAEEGAGASRAVSSTPRVRARKDPLTRNVCKLVQYLLQKLKMKEPITQMALMKFVKRKYKEQFPEILRKASLRMELIFGLELKKVNPRNHTYTVVNKLGLPVEGDLGNDEVVPKTGFVMLLLGMIFMKGNRVTEEEIWVFLDVLGVHPEKRHVVFGDPRRFVTQDLVQEMYLDYHLVPRSNPPCYEFLWGPRAYAETSKMKVLEILAKFNDKLPSAFPHLFSEALRDEEERAWFRAAVIAAPVAKGP